jgi:hypothetical protein
MTLLSSLHTTRGRFLAAVATVLLVGACRDATVPDLNNPQEAEFTRLTDRSQLQAVARGLIDQDRQSYATQVLFDEIMGRDLYRVDPAESRFITRLLGTSISNSDFIGNSVWTAPYRTARTVDFFLTSLDNTEPSFLPVLSAGEKAAATGYAQTIKALQLLRVIEQRDRNGAAVQTNAETIVPIRCEPAVLAYVGALLDTAAGNLIVAGATPFPFTLPAGFTGFTTPDAPGSRNDFLGFNRGLKARVEIYRGFQPLEDAGNSTTAPDQARLTAALSAMDSSFYSPTFTRGALDAGVYHTFATGQGETVNPLVDVGVFRANPRVVSEAEVGDQRVQSKVDTSSANQVRTLADVSSRYLVKFPGAPTDRLALLKNGELVAERALILWGQNQDAAALTLVNGIRSAAGLGPVVPADHQALLREILKQLRYEVLFESPVRWTMYRSLGILPELGRERATTNPVFAGNNPIARYPIPNAEAVARNGDIACRP